MTQHPVATRPCPTCQATFPLAGGKAVSLWVENGVTVEQDPAGDRADHLAEQERLRQGAEHVHREQDPAERLFPTQWRASMPLCKPCLPSGPTARSSRRGAHRRIKLAASEATASTKYTAHGPIRRGRARTSGMNATVK